MVGIMAAVGDAEETIQKDTKPRVVQSVYIGSNGVIMPLGRILLARKGSQYCAVKLTETWTGETKADIFTNYESYYLGDSTEDFSSKNAQFTKGQLAERNSIMFGKMVLYHTGPENKEIKCGPIKLFCLRGAVYFYHVGSPKKKGFIIDELAPTKWTDISQVNVFDPRVKWYRYVSMGRDIKIAVDKLWEDREDEKK
jgi:hypothetical protein